jgi:hypothetical protein
MAKPICVVYYNPEMNGNRINRSEINNSLSNMMPDYYVFCIPSWKSEDGSAEALELKVYYEKDFTEIQYNELKELIQKHLNESNTVSPPLA